MENTRKKENVLEKFKKSYLVCLKCILLYKKITVGKGW